VDPCYAPPWQVAIGKYVFTKSDNPFLGTSLSQSQCRR
jgi:hypothetical protein